jgi:lipase
MGHGRRFERLALEGLPGRTVLAPDLRGHGESTWDPPWDAATHVADLLATMDAQGVGRFDVVGHSFGGLLATRLAATAPERMGRVVLLDPAVGLPPERVRDEAEATRRDDGWTSVEEALAARLVDRPAHATAAVRDDLAIHLSHDPDGRFRLRFSRPAVIVGWSEIARPPVSLAGFPGELLLVIADEGGYVTPALRTALADDLGARFTDRTIASGHMVYWDAFEVTAALVAAFLAGAKVPLESGLPEAGAATARAATVGAGDRPP